MIDLSARRFLLRPGLVALVAVLGVTGCGSDPGPDPAIKVEQGKTIEESSTKGRSRPGIEKKEAAPVQRIKSNPG